MERKTALITGATSGIGEACARRFANGGYNIIITGRTADKLQALKAELETEGVSVLALAFDVCDRNATREAVNSIPDSFKLLMCSSTTLVLRAVLSPSTKVVFRTGTR